MRRWLVLLVVASCKQTSDAPKPASLRASVSVAESVEQAPALRPLPSGAAATERDEHVQMLMSGRSAAERLPLTASDPSAPYQPELFQQLTIESVAEPKR